jgi:hypothetical protein
MVEEDEVVVCGAGRKDGVDGRAMVRVSSV